MGFAMLHAPCFCCGRVFASNPRRVPSYLNQPICRTCIDRVNDARRARGNPLWEVPADAYEPLPEHEL